MGGRSGRFAPALGAGRPSPLRPGPGKAKSGKGSIVVPCPALGLIPKLGPLRRARVEDSASLDYSTRRSGSVPSGSIANPTGCSALCLGCGVRPPLWASSCTGWGIWPLASGLRPSELPSRAAASG